METKVAKIISDTMVVLAAGSNNGVREGMRFVIFEPGEEILDPESKESLGNMEIVKGRVQVRHVMPNMCLAKTDYTTETRFREVSPFGGMSALQRAILMRREPYQVETGEKLKIKDEDRDARYLNPDRTVRVGDRARQLED